MGILMCYMNVSGDHDTLLPVSRFRAFFRGGTFLPRNAMRKRGSFLSSGVCLSVCPSVTFVYCIHRAEDVVKLLSRLGSSVILVLFFTPCAETRFQREARQWGRRIHGGGESAIFD